MNVDLSGLVGSILIPFLIQKVFTCLLFCLISRSTQKSKAVCKNILAGSFCLAIFVGFHVLAFLMTEDILAGELD